MDVLDAPDTESCLTCARRIGTLNRRVGDWCEACLDGEPRIVPPARAQAWLAEAVQNIEERAARILAKAEADGTMATTREVMAQRIAERERRHA